MKLSIRTRLTLLITLIYFSVFLFLLAAGGLALYFGVKRDVNRQVQIERDWMIQLFEREFFALLTAIGPESSYLGEEFVEALNDIYGYKSQFVIFALKTKTGRRFYSEGGITNVLLSLPRGFLAKKAGFHTLRLDGKFYRALITNADWGTVVIGIENRTFFEVADEYREILLFGVPLTLLLVLTGGRFLAGLAMRPVIESAEAAENITLTNLTERLPQYTGKDEFGKLISTLNLMIARLEKGVNRVQQFTQDAAHELRTPLTTLRGELELAYQEGNLPDEMKSLLQKSLDKAILMSRIVDNLMLLAQSDTGNYPVRATRFRLDELVRDAADDLESLIDGRPIQASLKRCDELTITADRQLIQRLVLNLCDNAARATREGKIELSLQQSGEVAELIVEDTGAGIPAEHLPHIFDRFYRIDKNRSRAGGGSGLGLSICKWVVDTHRGSIDIKSQLTKGTRIMVQLPLDRFSS